LVIASTVYKYSGGTYIIDHILPYANTTYRQFIDDEPSQLFVATTASLIIYDCQAKSELFSTTAQFDYNRIVFDQHSKKVVGEDFGQKVFDLPTRTLRSISVNPYYAFFSGGAFFTYSTLDANQYVLTDY
jgi:hypothetical protein